MFTRGKRAEIMSLLIASTWVISIQATRSACIILLVAVSKERKIKETRMGKMVTFLCMKWRAVGVLRERKDSNP